MSLRTPQLRRPRFWLWRRNLRTRVARLMCGTHPQGYLLPGSSPKGFRGLPQQEAPAAVGTWDTVSTFYSVCFCLVAFPEPEILIIKSR